jgi:hypothetical protein
MDIKTKYNINDDLYYMEANRVNTLTVLSISINIDKNKKEIFYHSKIGVYNYTHEEHKLFKTKEELIKSL